eukprot:COSAG02_NODE_20221_length_842_cov_1.220727_1_plen_75_part_10
MPPTAPSRGSAATFAEMKRQAHTRHHRHLELAELVWFACLEATDVPYALTDLVLLSTYRYIQYVQKWYVSVNAAP